MLHFCETSFKHKIIQVNSFAIAECIGSEAFRILEVKFKAIYFPSDLIPLIQNSI